MTATVNRALTFAVTSICCWFFLFKLYTERVCIKVGFTINCFLFLIFLYCFDYDVLLLLCMMPLLLLLLLCFAKRSGRLESFELGIRIDLFVELIVILERRISSLVQRLVNVLR